MINPIHVLTTRPTAGLDRTSDLLVDTVARYEGRLTAPQLIRQLREDYGASYRFVLKTVWQAVKQIREERSVRREPDSKEGKYYLPAAR